MKHRTTKQCEEKKIYNKKKQKTQTQNQMEVLQPLDRAVVLNTVHPHPFSRSFTAPSNKM